MSYMTLLEKSARNSAAIALINRTRHWLQKREGAEVSSEDLKVLQESFEMGKKENFNKIVSYNFQGMTEGLFSVAPKISDALREGAKTLQDGDSIMNTFARIIRDGETPTQQAEKENIVKLLEETIRIIGAGEKHRVRQKTQGQGI